MKRRGARALVMLGCVVAGGAAMADGPATTRATATRPATRPTTTRATVTRPATRPTTTRAAATQPSQAATPEDPYVQVLEGMGIAPDASGIGRYLRQLEPDEKTRARVRALIRQMGARQYRLREAATQELLRMLAVPMEELARATKDPDLEIQLRAQHIIERRGQLVAAAMRAAFHTIAARKIKGLADEVLAAIPKCWNQQLVEDAARALRATARAQDTPMLRKALGGANVEVRVAAAGALAELLAPEQPDKLYDMLTDSEDRVSLTVARVLADRGDRQCLGALCRLLSSKDVVVRVRSAAILRQVTGRNFRYAAYNEAADRAKAVAAWKQWIDTEGRTAKLIFPLRPPTTGVGDLQGNTLIAYGYRNKVEEITPAGKVVWNCAARGVWSAEKLPNGNVLVAAYQENKVKEVNRDGKVVWEYGVNCLNAKPLPNGNVLIADHSGRRAIEVTRDKKIIWSYKTPHNCTDAQRLPNGNTLVGGLNFVQEIAPTGKVVWTYNAAGTVYGVRRLANGNTLLARMQQPGVVEVSPAGKIVWQYPERSVSDAFRLPNGNTLIVTSQKLIEVTPAKKVVQEKTGIQYGSARR